VGSIYKQGNIYWIKFYRAGKAYRESSRSKKPGPARRLLKKREGEIVENRFYGLRVEKIRFEELAEDFLNDYRTNAKKSLERAEMSLKHLKKSFEGVRAIDISTDRIRVYILERQEQGAENGTINRELAALKRMFSLARQMTPAKVTQFHISPIYRRMAQGKGTLSMKSILQSGRPYHSTSSPLFQRPIIPV
jgi:hypothetical protein